ncbi:MAG: protocatechuate 3,4-dioxygenase beta subunit [Pseudohongiellaceae bacterium]|jgi:protocatechuate 3,4-dioxygenase beta subunit
MRSSRSSKSSPLPILLGLFAAVIIIAGGALLLLEDTETPELLPEGQVVQAEQQRETPTTIVAAAEPTDTDRSKIKVPQIQLSNGSALPMAVSDPGGPVGALAGIAVDPEGRPVSGAEVRLYKGSALTNVSLARQPLPNFAVTDIDGKFSMEGVPVDRNYVVVGEHPDFALAEHTGIVVRDGQLSPGLRLAFGMGAVIQGVVTSLAENPIAEARVELYDTVSDARLKPANRRPWKIVFTDAYGRFAFLHVSTISLKVRVEAVGFESQTHMLSSALQAGPSDQELSFRLATGQPLGGRVVDENGTGIPGVRLEANALKREYQGNSVAFSDDNGYFLLEGMSTEYPYQLRSEKEGFSTKTVPQVRVSDANVLVVMQSRGQVKGYVTNSSGAPITDFSVALMRARPGSDPQLMADLRHFTDSKGEFVFDNLEPGSYAFEGRSSDYASSQSEAVVVERGGHIVEVRISMLEGATLRGTVFGTDGKPMHRALVSVNVNNFADSPILKIFAALAPSAEVKIRIRTNAKGRFQIKHIPPGIYQVSVKHPESALLIQNDVGLDEAQILDLELRLSTGATVSGRALNENRLPLAYTQVQINQKSGFADSVTTDQNGEYNFENLREGTYSLSVNPERINDKPVAPLVRLVYATRSKREISLRDGQILGGVDLYVEQQQ